MEAVSRAKDSQKSLPHQGLGQLVNYVEKTWGHEEWIVNNEKYCGKKLVVRAGHRCSLHYHKIKEETFYVLQGKIYLETEFGGVRSARIMQVGGIATIYPNMLHRFTALENSEIMEFSTYHLDEDSYRVELSSSVNLSQLKIE